MAGGQLQPSLFDERDLAEITVPSEYPGERLIACRNPLLADERARKRNALLDKTESNLKRIAQGVRRAPKKSTAAVIGLKVGAVIDKQKMRQHFVLEISDGHFSFRRDQASMTAAANLDGFHVIRTSVVAKDLSAEEGLLDELSGWVWAWLGGRSAA